MGSPSATRGSYFSSLKDLQKVALKNLLYYFLAPYAKRDRVLFEDDFTGDTIHLDDWAVANGGGASAASFAISSPVQTDGWITATTGTAGDDTASASMIGPAIYRGNSSVGIECRFKPITAVTETKIEIGMLDVLPGVNKSAILSVVTPTVNTSVVEGALYSYRHAGATTTNQLITIGNAVTAQKSNFTPALAIAAAKSYTVRIQLERVSATVALASIFFNGLWIDSIQAAMTGAVKLAPFVYFAASNGTSKSLDIDYIRVIQNRDFLTAGLEQ